MTKLYHFNSSRGKNFDFFDSVSNSSTKVTLSHLLPISLDLSFGRRWAMTDYDRSKRWRDVEGQESVGDVPELFKIGE